MNVHSFIKLVIFMFFVSFCTNYSILAQAPLTIPRVSPHASITQTIGLSTVTINYHRPAVKERKVWGNLVPFGLTNLGFGGGNPAPWRAGANENTTISFSHDALVEGNKVEAGTYGLHMIPSESDWTIILSKQSTAWGSFFYDENEDYLRFMVTPHQSNFNEWLQYSFQDITSNSVAAALQWEKLLIPFKIEFDVHTIVVNSFEEELIGSRGFFWNGFNQAASYCVNNNVFLDKAIIWIDKAISLNRSMTTLLTKSRILSVTGKSNGSRELLQQALEIGNEAEINNYGYQLMGQGDIDGALDVFKINIERNPDSWNAYDSLGEALKNKGEIEKSREAYNKAKSIAPENQKGRIDQILSTL